MNDETQGVGVLVKDPSQDIIIKLKTIDESGYHLNHLWFTEICPDEKIKFDSTNGIEYIVDYIVAISLNIFDDKKFRYTIITKKWMVRKCDGIYELPSISKHYMQMMGNTESSIQI